MSIVLGPKDSKIVASARTSAVNVRVRPVPPYPCSYSISDCRADVISKQISIIIRFTHCAISDGEFGAAADIKRCAARNRWLAAGCALEMLALAKLGEQQRIAAHGFVVRS